MEYALSSSRVVSRLCCHEIRSTVVKVDRSHPFIASIGIFVMSLMLVASEILSPNFWRSMEKNSTDVGSRSS